jgi:vacuolar-type H+-ATPase subunit H
MGRVKDLLERFRPAGAPGSATIVGVPADRVSELATELEPVLGLLDGAEAESLQIVLAAKAAAGQRRTMSSARARQLVDEARQQAAVVRAEVAARARAQLLSEERAVLETARAQADRIAEISEQRMPVMVEHVIETVRRIGHDPAADTNSELTRRS